MSLSPILSAGLATLVFLAFPSRAQDTVTISKSRLSDLEAKAARADALATELAEARAELARLKKEEKQAERKPARWLPPAVEKAAQQAPAPRPLPALAPASPTEMVS